MLVAAPDLTNFGQVYPCLPCCRLMNRCMRRHEASQLRTLNSKRSSQQGLRQDSTALDFLFSLSSTSLNSIVSFAYVALIDSLFQARCKILERRGVFLLTNSEVRQFRTKALSSLFFAFFLKSLLLVYKLNLPRLDGIHHPHNDYILRPIW